MTATWAAQGPSRSPILVPIESLYATFYLNSNLGAPSHFFEFGNSNYCFYFTSSFAKNSSWTLGCEIWSQKTRNITLLYHMVHKYFDHILNCLCMNYQCDEQTYRQNCDSNKAVLVNYEHNIPYYKAASLSKHSGL